MASTPGEPFLRAKVKPLKLKPRCSEFSRLGPKPENYASTGSRATGPRTGAKQQACFLVRQ